MTLADIVDVPPIHEIPARGRLLYIDKEGQPTEAGEFVRRGLCPYPHAGGFCGRDRDTASVLGHCTRHFTMSGE